MAQFLSIRVEKASLLRRVNIWLNCGESMRSEVSSRRWRRLELLCGDEASEAERTPDSSRT